MRILSTFSLILVAATSQVYAATNYCKSQYGENFITLDSASQFQSVINSAMTTGQFIFIPNGEYTINAMLDLNDSNPVTICGESKSGVVLKTNISDPLFGIQSQTTLDNMTLINTASKGTAIYVRYSSSFSDMKNLAISGFHTAYSGRKHLYSSFENIDISDVNIGIELHSDIFRYYVVHNNNQYGSRFPKTDGKFNNNCYVTSKPPCQTKDDDGNLFFYDDGWFNNVLRFKNISVSNFTDYGIKMQAMTVQLDNVSLTGASIDSSVGLIIDSPQAHPERMLVQKESENLRAYNLAFNTLKLSNLKTGIIADEVQYISLNTVNKVGDVLELVNAKNVDYLKLENVPNAERYRFENTKVHVNSKLTNIDSINSMFFIENEANKAKSYQFALAARGNSTQVAIPAGYDCLAISSFIDGYSKHASLWRKSNGAFTKVVGPDNISVSTTGNVVKLTLNAPSLKRGKATFLPYSYCD
ncbi:hypothetical protein [Pseudoalteromonas byunsanensis]|uniref:Pectate lyase superfamily protein domain-containing protein n=1 Tax=Pseudoalteromonas byunsanensis TaxID=327939 RepID=A0A1S1NBX7_9GAMM|nr:hypothetical protein [Pseudoalteromonas byunsanensis]OHU96908.1 hypothetical protein BIW53_03365 [Pseudoalteromonas byunsanensis]